MALLETGISLNLDIKLLGDFQKSLESIQTSLGKVANPFADIQSSIKSLNRVTGVSRLTEKFKELNAELKIYKASGLFQVNVQRPKSPDYLKEEVFGLQNRNTQKFVGLVQKNAINQDLGTLKVDLQNIRNINEYNKGIENTINKQKLNQANINLKLEKQKLIEQQILDLKNKQNKELEKSNFSMSSFAKNMLGGYLGYQGIKLLTNSVINARLEYEKTLVVFSNILPNYGFSQSIKERQKMSEVLFRDISSFAKKYKMDPYAISTPVAQFMGTKLAGFDLNTQLATAKNILKLTSQFQLSPDQTNNVVLAFGQIASKGIVSMEEFRRQLGNYMPGFTDMMAKAMKLSPAQLTQLISSGQLTASTFFKALNKQTEIDLAGYKPAANLTNSLVSLKTAFKDMVVAFSSGLLGATLRKLIDGLTMLLNIITKLMPIIKAFGTLWLIGFIKGKFTGLSSATTALKNMGMYIYSNTVLLKNMRNAAALTANSISKVGNAMGLNKTVIPADIGNKYAGYFSNSLKSQRIAAYGAGALALGGGIMLAADYIPEQYKKTKTGLGWFGSALSGAGATASLMAPLALAFPMITGVIIAIGALVSVFTKNFLDKKNKEDTLKVEVSATGNSVINSISSTRPITISTTSLTGGMLGAQY